MSCPCVLTLSSPLYLSYALLSAYCLSGCLIEHFAVFRGWQDLITSDDPPVETSLSDTTTSSSTEKKDRAASGNDQEQLKQQLKDLQRTNGYAIAVLYVLPKIVLTGLNMYLVSIYGRITTTTPSSHPIFSISIGRGLNFSGAMLAASWAQSFMVMIPAQRRIRASAEKKDVDALVRSSKARVAFMVIHAGLVGWTVLV